MLIVAVLVVASLFILVQPVHASANTIALSAISPQYYIRGATVSFSGTVTGPGTSVGIIVKDTGGANIFTDQVTPSGGAFSGNFRNRESRS